MESGNRRRAEGRALALLVSSLLALLSLVSCGRPGFVSRLSELDSALAKMEEGSLDPAFEKACASASSSSDWLSVLKRARYAEAAGDAGRYAWAASAAIAGGRPSDPVAAAAAHAFLRGGAPEKAIGLLRDPAAKGGWVPLYIEAFYAGIRSGTYAPTPADYSFLASLPSGDLSPPSARRSSAPAARPAAQMAAAAASLAAADIGQAASYARRAIEAGLDPDILPAPFAWDCGLYDELASRYDGVADPGELALLGDAAFRAGDLELARLRWSRAASLAPPTSWKALQKLAITAPTGSEEAASLRARMAAALGLQVTGSALRSAAQAKSASTEGLVAYAAELARRGEDADALGLVRQAGSETPARLLEFSVLARTWPEGRLVAEAIRFAEERQSDGQAVEGVMRLLAERGRIGEMIHLFDAGDRRGLAFANRWWYQAAVDAVRGDFQAAIGALEGGAEGEGAYPAAFALGTLREALGNALPAAAAYTAAAAAAADGAGRCSALKRLGKVLAASGDFAAAATAFSDAFAADPADAESALLMRRAADDARRESDG